MCNQSRDRYLQPIRGAFILTLPRPEKDVCRLFRLVGSGWGAGAKTLRMATLSLVYSTAEYCAPVWCRSAHTRLIDSVLNDALHIVIGCLRPTPTDHLPVLSGIQPAELRLMRATLSLAYHGSFDLVISCMVF